MIRFLLSPILIPFTLIFILVAWVRSKLFDLGKLEQTEFPETRIVSIGNVSSGGTGKTPIALMLAEALTERGHKLGIVSRGYGRSSKGLREVLVSSNPSEVGDEPLLIKTRISNARVFVAEKRAEAVKAVLDQQAVDLVLADDAFQHRSLKRNLDIVLFDATQGVLDYIPLPFGRAREGRWAWSRADIAVITKANMASAAHLQDLHERCQISGIKHIFDANYNLECVIPLESYLSTYKTSDIQPVEFLKKNIFASSGIARPDVFMKTLKGAQITVVGQKHFSDHHNFNQSDVDQIWAASKTSGADAIMITEKDAIKWDGIRVPADYVFVAKLKVSIANFEELYGLVIGKTH